MNSIKGWLIDVGIKKMGPSAIRGALLGLGGWVIAKHEMLVPFGISYDAATHIISINLDTANIALVALLPAIGASVIKLLNHHASEIVVPKKDENPSIPKA